MYTLPKLSIPDGKLMVRLEWGFSSAGSDIDNACKPLLDILQIKYDFNDNRIWRMELIKKKVQKGQEYIKFEFNALEIDND